VAAPVYADGGISSLSAVLGPLLLGIGTGGLVVVALMVPAVQAGIRKNRADKWVVAALSLGVLYVLCSLFFYFGTMHEEWAKFPGFVAVVAFALLCIFFLRHQKRLRVAVLASIGIVTVAMLATPAQFWKGNAFDLVETIFFDNSQDLEGMLLGKNRDNIDSRKTLLQFADGRKIL